MKAQARSLDRSDMIAELRKQHVEYDRQLKALSDTRHLTPGEQVEVRRLKRLKLSAKDKIHYLSSL